MTAKKTKLLQAKDITKTYHGRAVVNNVCIDVGGGEIVGLLGPNGAGKTTIIKILTGYLQPDEGVVTVNGLDVLEHTREVQAEIGYLPETAPLYPELSVQAYLKMMADLRQIPEADQTALLSEAIFATGLFAASARPNRYTQVGVSLPGINLGDYDSGLDQ